MTVEERARRYVARIPEAIPGQHGHATMFKVACVLVQGFSLDVASARALLVEYNKALTEPFTSREMDHKLKEAAKAVSIRGQGYLLNPSDRPIRVPIKTRKSADTPPEIIHRVVFGTLGTGISYEMTKTLQTKEHNKNAGEAKTPVPPVPDEIIGISGSTWALAEKFAREFSGRIISPEEINLPADYWES